MKIYYDVIGAFPKKVIFFFEKVVTKKVIAVSNFWLDTSRSQHDAMTSIIQILLFKTKISILGLYP